MEGGVNHEYSGQIDILPTLFHLLGTDTKDYVQFGTDLFSEDHDELIPFRNGEYVSPTITAIEGKYYDSVTGLQLTAEQEEQIETAKQFQEIVSTKLALSDKVVNGDLLRFYTPEGFTPVERTEYDYNKDNEQTTESKSKE